MKVLADSGEDSCPDLHRAAFSLCTHMASPCCMHVETERSLSLPLLIKALIPSDEGCTFMTSINFSYKGFMLKYSNTED